jgi:hypothetical protein
MAICIAERKALSSALAEAALNKAAAIDGITAGLAREMLWHGQGTVFAVFAVCVPAAN